MPINLALVNLRHNFPRYSNYRRMLRFYQAKHFVNQSPSSLVIQWLDFIRYFLTIASSTYTLSRLMSKNATQLLLLNGVKLGTNVYRLITIYCTTFPNYSNNIAGAVRYKVLNKAWHRLNLMKGFSLNENLRRDISITGIESWLTSEMSKANVVLGGYINSTSLASPGFFHEIFHSAHDS